jgi:hypothetical protein
LAASIWTTKFPSVVSKVASQTEVVVMQSGGAFVNQTTRMLEPFAGGQVGATALVLSGNVDGGGNVDDVVVELVVVATFFFGPPLVWINTTIPMMTATSTMADTTRLSVVRRFR